MILDVKFAAGDKVFVMHQNKIVETKVQKVIAEHGYFMPFGSAPRWIVKYDLGLGGQPRYEEDVYASKDELVESLIG